MESNTENMCLYIYGIKYKNICLHIDGIKYRKHMPIYR